MAFKTRKAVLATTVLAAMTFAASPAHAQVDIEDVCTSIIGDRAGTIDLRPIAIVGYKTCALASTRD